MPYCYESPHKDIYTYIQGCVRVTPENLKESCRINPVAEEWQQAVVTIFIMLIHMEI